MKGDHACCCVGVLIGISLIGVFYGVFILKRSTEEITEIKQIHVVFCHGERTPTKSEIEIYPFNINKNETYYPHGLGALTNEGKTKMYDVGEAIRKQYDGFLSRIYNQEDIVMQAIDRDISKISALLLLAGMWPVEQEDMWTDIKWQPIPYRNLEAEDDYMLYEENCPRYIQERQIVKQIYKDKMQLSHKDLFQRLSLFTGRNITEPSHVQRLRNLLMVQDDMKMVNPKWFKTMKKSLEYIVKVEYNMMFHNTILRKLSAGALLQKMITDSKERIKQDQSGMKGTNVFMYSGYLNNIAAILAATKIIKPHQPEFGAAFILELHLKPVTNDYIYKLFYWDDDSAVPRLLKLPKCKTLCPVDEFERHMSEILVINYEEECHVITK